MGKKWKNCYLIVILPHAARIWCALSIHLHRVMSYVPDWPDADSMVWMWCVCVCVCACSKVLRHAAEIFWSLLRWTSFWQENFCLQKYKIHPHLSDLISISQYSSIWRLIWSATALCSLHYVSVVVEMKHPLHCILVFVYKYCILQSIVSHYHLQYLHRYGIFATLHPGMNPETVRKTCVLW